MSEYIYTDMPRYMKTTPRENFSNSVVNDGSVLLFSEDGETLVAKLPDGTFHEIGSGGSEEYYRCASVDTSAKTWTGYRAVLNEGVYTLEDTVTTGLSYTSVIPQVGSIYSADALVYVSSLYTGIPTDGLVFYAPLSENKTEAETGQTMNFSGTVVYDVFDGVNGAFFNNAYFSASIGSTLSEWTLSFWLKVTENQTSGAGYFNSKTNGEILIYINSSSRNLRFYPPDDLGTNVAPENWNHFMVASSGNTCSVYQNGIFYSNKTWNQAKAFDQFYIGSRYSEGTIKAYTAGLRIYNRVLSEMEAASLASEFTPTQVIHEHGKTEKHG